MSLLWKDISAPNLKKMAMDTFDPLRHACSETNTFRLSDYIHFQVGTSTVLGTLQYGTVPREFKKRQKVSIIVGNQL